MRDLLGRRWVLLAAASLFLGGLASVLAARQSLTPKLFVVPVLLVGFIVLSASTRISRPLSVLMFLGAAFALLLFMALASATVGLYFLPSLVLGALLFTLRFRGQDK